MRFLPHVHNIIIIELTQCFHNTKHIIQAINLVNLVLHEEIQKIATVRYVT